MKDIRQFLFTDLFTIDRKRWRTWKTWAVIGLLYGVLGWIYFGSIILLQSPQSTPSPPLCDGCGAEFAQFGYIIFFPIIYVGYFAWGWLSHIIHIDAIFFTLACMPLSGLILGAGIGYCVKRFNAIE